MSQDHQGGKGGREKKRESTSLSMSRSWTVHNVGPACDPTLKREGGRKGGEKGERGRETSIINTIFTHLRSRIHDLQAPFKELWSWKPKGKERRGGGGKKKKGLISGLLSASQNPSTGFVSSRFGGSRT